VARAASLHRHGPWLCLAVVLALFLAHLAALEPAAGFSWYHDNTLYFSSAKAVAEGRGHILPSVPGSPPQSKYPLLYPWLLSWIWKWRPSFPDNVPIAIGLTAFFSCWFLIAAFQLLRKLGGTGDWLALVFVSLTAFHPVFLALSGAVLSDMPFAALVVTAAIVSDAAFSLQGQRRTAILAGVLAGLSLEVRSLGVPVVAGIVACGLYRRRWRQTLLFSLAAGVLLLPGVARIAAGAQAPGWDLAGEQGWRQTVFYYSSYWRFWKLSVPDAGVLGTMALANLKSLLEQPASYCLFPPLGGSRLGLMACVALTAWILAGVWRQGRSAGWKPIHFVFPFYGAAILLWNYALADRFLLLFMPLFYAGLWTEASRLCTLLRGSWRAGQPASQRALAAGMGLAVAAVFGLAVDHYARGFRPQLRARNQNLAALAPEAAEAYVWIRQNTDPAARFLAYTDALLWLHTGRQAIRPISFTTDLHYGAEKGRRPEALASIADVGRKIGARYWISTEADFLTEGDLRPLLEATMAQLESALPLVFRSGGHKVRIYDVSCLVGGEECPRLRRHKGGLAACNN